ncbi:hypothetical protein JHK82_025038 [Glycine max]|nr:hypothetical protein JHK82_025038 [Glycine max]
MWWPFSRIGSSGFSSYSTAEEVTHGIDGSGLTAIVTGASSGLGAETARVLALRGVHVIMGVIDMIGAKTIKEAILKEIPIAKVDVMENNAGICAAPFALSKDNIELQFAINYLGLHKIAWLFGLEKILGYMAKNVQQGASTTCYVALHPQVSGISGKYFEDNNLAEVYSHGRDMNLAKKLWDFSINLTK